MKLKNEDNIGITNEQIIKMAFRKILQDDFAEIKEGTDPTSSSGNRLDDKGASKRVANHG
jgi:hypothetical protein